MQPDDAHLVEDVLSGDSECFRTLVMRHTAMVRAVIYSMVGGESAADDLAQEAFLRSFKYLASLTDHSKYGGWLCGITRRVCLDYLRSKRRPMLSLDEISEAGGEFARPEDATAELRNSVHEAVLNLPDELRQVTLMRYVDRFSYEKMAQILGVSRATISARLIQARKLLRDKLADQ